VAAADRPWKSVCTLAKDDTFETAETIEPTRKNGD
jgi:hypothetical protein